MMMDEVWSYIRPVLFYGLVVPWLVFYYARMVVAGILSAFEYSDQKLLKSPHSVKDGQDAAPRQQTNQSVRFRPSED